MSVRAARIGVEDRIRKLETCVDEFIYNKACDVTYYCTKDIFPEWSGLKRDMVWPRPKKMSAEFLNKVGKGVMVEELSSKPISGNGLQAFSRKG